MPSWPSSRWTSSRLAVRLTTLAVLAVLASCSPIPSQPTTVGTRQLGVSTDLSGPDAAYGQAVSHGVEVALDQLNARGGVDHYRIEAAIEDDGDSPQRAAANFRDLIHNHRAVALIAPITSAACAAASPVAGQGRTPTFAVSCNDYQLETSPRLRNPYWIGIVPNTYMEGCAMGLEAASQDPESVYVFSPDYAFGREETSAFAQCLRSRDPHARFLDPTTAWYVPLDTSDWGPIIDQIQQEHPGLVYTNLFGPSQLGFIQQAQAADPTFFQDHRVMTLGGVQELDAEKDQYPIGMELAARAPYFALRNPAMDAFAAAYDRSAGTYPSDWAVLAYDAVMVWAHAAAAAGTLDGPRVLDQILGHSFPTLEGYSITVRALDGQATSGVTIGTTTPSLGRYPFPIFSDPTTWRGSSIMIPTALVQELQAGRCPGGSVTACP